MIILTYKVNELLLINKMEASIRHLYAMGAGLTACNPPGGGNDFVNLFSGPSKAWLCQRTGSELYGNGRRCGLFGPVQAWRHCLI